MVRLIPEFRGAIDPESLDDINDLIQARIDGGISRRQLVKRAAQIGIAAPVVGVMLHATSDMAYGQPSLGRDRTIARMQDATIKEVTGPTKPAGTPKEGGTLVASSISEPDTLNPWVTQLVTTSDVCCGVFGGLMRYDSAQQIIPDLAESYEISNDGLTYTFKLRQGVTFHDGAAFTAKDVDATWKAIMIPDLTAYQQLGWDQITKLDMPDDFTVVMSIGESYAPFVSYMADPISGAIVSTGVLEKGPDYFRGDFGRKPFGTGPFKIDEWKAKEQVSLFRYDGYWGTKPKLDQIIYRINPDDNTQLVQLQTGEAQLASSDGAISPARVDEVLGFGTVDVYESPNMAWSHLDLKEVDFLRITKVRQALDYATPTQDIIDKIMKGRVVRAFADQAPVTTVYATDITPRPYDPEKAKQLLTEAGLTQNGDGIWEGPTPTPSKDIDPNTDRGGPVKQFNMEYWHVSGDSVEDQIGQVIAQAWSSIGIKTEVKSEDISTIWGPEGYQFDPNTMTAAKYSWYNSNDPDNMYFWHSSQIPPDPTGAGGNITAYFFPLSFQAKADELTDAGVKETDPEKRKAIYIELQHLIADETPVVFLWWGKDFAAVQPTIGGFWPSPFNRLLWNAQDWYFAE
jgi:peptide/nickel transport system substrate-binding protein